MGPSTENNTLLLVFAHSAKAEMEHKPIANGELLFDALTQQTLKTAKKTGLPYIHLDETLQIGTTFGEKFTNALQHFFNQGYEQIIAVGNDSPELKKAHIKKASEQLNKDNTVVGPSKDGGFYLLGIHRSQFNATTFRELPWQTPSTAKNMISLIFERGATVFKLPYLSDIDHTRDLYRHFTTLKNLSQELIGIILLILQSVVHQNRYTERLVPIPNSTIPFNKGSPLL